MMKKTIYGLFAAAAILTGMAACSDNYDKQLEPVETTATFDVNLVSDKYDKHGGKITLTSSPDEITVEVKCNTRWAAKLVPNDNSSNQRAENEENKDVDWCEIDAFNGIGNGSFKLFVSKNMESDRSCTLEIYTIDAEGKGNGKGSDYINIKQEASAVRLSPSSVEPFPADPTTEPVFDIISNIPWTLTLTYEAGNASEFVTIIPDTGMESGANGSFTGTGDAKFKVQLQSNRTASNRSAFLNLTSELGTSTVELSQSYSKDVFDISSNASRVIPAAGGEVDFSVLSVSPWKVSSNVDWIEFSKAEGNANLETADSIKALIKPNSEGYRREATITFTPTEAQYKEMETVINLTQSGYDLTFSFSVNPNDQLGVLLADRQTKQLELDSRFNWKTILPDWITATPSTGDKSNSAQEIILNIAENTTGAKRDGTVIFCPLPTKFEGGAELDPKVLGIDSLSVNLTQFGGQDPAISIPWLADGYTQTSATIEFSYYSPFYPISEAGLEWRKADSADNEEWEKLSKTVDNATTGKVSFDISDLDPATKYVARGYVIYRNDQKMYGGTTTAFTTSGKRPGADDNPTPQP